ncbi:MAG: hypothetical protein AAFN78_01390 [Pseudomonadota bacterium]
MMGDPADTLWFKFWFPIAAGLWVLGGPLLFRFARSRSYRATLAYRSFNALVWRAYLVATLVLASHWYLGGPGHREHLLAVVTSALVVLSPTLWIAMLVRTLWFRDWDPAWCYSRQGISVWLLRDGSLRARTRERWDLAHLHSLMHGGLWLAAMLAVPLCLALGQLAGWSDYLGKIAFVGGAYAANSDTLWAYRAFTWGVLLTVVATAWLHGSAWLARRAFGARLPARARGEVVRWLPILVLPVYGATALSVF